MEVAWANPPVCKLLDFGKYKYQMSKNRLRAKIDIKEIKIRPQIGIRSGLKVRIYGVFLDEGHKAKVMMFFRGRDGKTGAWIDGFRRLTQMLPDKFNIEMKQKLEGNHITMVIGPSSK